MQRQERKTIEAKSLGTLPLVIGTRGSPLALYQARLVQRRLARKARVSGPSIEDRFPIKIFTTTGDRLTGKLADFGGKGLFTRELETALIAGEIDMAVHSMKDVPTQSQETLTIAAVLRREDVRDAFMSHKILRLQDLPPGALVGTASIRRRAQLSRLRPDIQYCLLRGNVGTRLDKLERGDCAATFLACAGLNRLGQSEMITQKVSTRLMLPAPAQGAIGIEICTDNEQASIAVRALDHGPTHIAIMAERAFLRALDGSCRTPVAALATLRKHTLRFRGEVLSLDGSQCFRIKRVLDRPTMQTAFDMGLAAGRALKYEIGDKPLWDEL